MIRRLYVEKKAENAEEAQALLSEIHGFLGIQSVQSVRILNRYDVDGLDDETWPLAVSTVFSDPTVDRVLTEKPAADYVLAVEPLPGQFDQRADSAQLCLLLLAQKTTLVRTAVVYCFEGNLSKADREKIRTDLINPVEAREARMELPDTLQETPPTPGAIPVIDGLTAMQDDALSALRAERGLAMDLDDLKVLQAHFQSIGRNPTETELRMIDTYWSDHCRHTTFQTIVDEVHFTDPLIEETYQKYLALREETNDQKPICLMDIALIGARYLRQTGRLTNEDVSEEINACTVKVDVTVDGRKEPWLLLFKNETHNHPTEIEPFGGASTCIGGAIRDPLAGRAYVYAAMRVTGAADPRTPLNQTIPGKLPQRKIVTQAAQGYASYGNQIGLATGIVHEVYHPGYAAKRMEVGAVIGAVPADAVVRETPAPGDVVVLLGGRTGRDGIGGATGSSKAHTSHSVETAGAEVQKGNAPEERKLQRFIRHHEAARMIRRMNDFGAGGVSVAIGELADGMIINLDQVPKKYEGLSGTELAISESQERMAAVVAPADLDRFLEIAAAENLEATPVATITEEPRLVMEWQGQRIVDLARAFLDSNGAKKHISIPTGTATWHPDSSNAEQKTTLEETVLSFAKDLRHADQHGLVDRFDSTIGAGTVLMPYGGIYRATPIQAMVHQIALEHGRTDTCSFMSWAFTPEVSAESPFHGAYLSIVESLAKLLATGASRANTNLSLQEYFPRPGDDGTRWAAPLEALLGALRAQVDLGVGAIGGKDSMSGTFEHLDVPPSLISFAVTTDTADRVLSPEWSTSDLHLTWISPKWVGGLPDAHSLNEVFDTIAKLSQRRDVDSIVALGADGLLGAILDAAAGNRIGATLAPTLTMGDLTRRDFGGFLVASKESVDEIGSICVRPVGTTTAAYILSQGAATIDLLDVERMRRETLEPIFPTKTGDTPAALSDAARDAVQLAKAARTAKAAAPTKPLQNLLTGQTAVPTPRVAIPVFPGTNCEVDSARYVRQGGLSPEIQVLQTQSQEQVKRSVESMALAIRRAQVLFLPGGFSGGDEPEGSAKLINAFFRNPALAESVEDLLARGGLILGVCNGFQALVKMGLLPFGQMMSPGEDLASLTYNTIGRHQSHIVATRIVSDASPWLSHVRAGDIVRVPISHGEGRLKIADTALDTLFKNGQVATQYVDPAGMPSMDIRYNPNGSPGAVEGLLSPDGRILGKMGHSERVGKHLYKNIPEVQDLRLFESAAAFLKK